MNSLMSVMILYVVSYCYFICSVLCNSDLQNVTQSNHSSLNSAVLAPIDMPTDKSRCNRFVQNATPNFIGKN